MYNICITLSDIPVDIVNIDRQIAVVVVDGDHLKLF